MNTIEFIQCQQIQMLKNIVSHLLTQGLKHQSLSMFKAPETLNIEKKIQPEKISSKKEKKTRVNTDGSPGSDVERNSASKKYPGQLMRGFFLFLAKKLPNPENQVSKKILEIASTRYSGKNGQDYKMSSVQKIRKEIFDIENLGENKEGLDYQVRLAIQKYFIEFMEIDNYYHWVDVDFKGFAANKLWLKNNYTQIKTRVLNGIKLPFGRTNSDNSEGSLEGKDSIESDMKQEFFSEGNVVNKRIKTC